MYSQNDYVGYYLIHYFTNIGRKDLSRTSQRIMSQYSESVLGNKTVAQMKSHSRLFSFIRVYKILKIFGLCTFVWPFLWNFKIFRTIGNVIHYYILANFIFVFIIPTIVFILANIRDTAACIGTTIVGLGGLEAFLTLLYCKVKKEQYKVKNRYVSCRYYILTYSEI